MAPDVVYPLLPLACGKLINLLLLFLMLCKTNSPILGISSILIYVRFYKVIFVSTV